MAVLRIHEEGKTPTISPRGGGYKSARDCAVQLARRHRNIAFGEKRIGIVTPRVVERLPNGIRLIERDGRRITTITFEE